MPKFKIGDRVKRIGTLLPTYMRDGVVKAVIPHDDLPEHLTEYDVDFKFVVARFYESQLTLVAAASS